MKRLARAAICVVVLVVPFGEPTVASPPIVAPAPALRRRPRSPSPIPRVRTVPIPNRAPGAGCRRSTPGGSTSSRRSRASPTRPAASTSTSAPLRPSGGGCVTPEVFDIDLYVDTNVSGEGNFVVNTAAVDAIHAAGGHAICYIDAGDAETYRPDYQRFVDFDEACDGCLIGNPFSQVFPDEFFLNINNDEGQRAFILQVNRDRRAEVRGGRVRRRGVGHHRHVRGSALGVRHQLPGATDVQHTPGEHGASVRDVRRDEERPVTDRGSAAVLRLRDRRGVLRVPVLLGEPIARRGRVHRSGQSGLRGGVPAHARRVLRGRREPRVQCDQEVAATIPCSRQPYHPCR